MADHHRQLTSRIFDSVDRYKYSEEKNHSEKKKERKKQTNVRFQYSVLFAWIVI